MKETKIIFHILTAFPEVFGYLYSSILKKAQQKKIITIKIHDLKNFVDDNLDERPYGGGPGMVMKPEPFLKALEKIIRKSKFTSKQRKIIFFDLKGKIFNQKLAHQIKKYREIILICGHYEGVDERVAKVSNLKISIGNFILSGGELPAMVIIDTITRLLPGVLNNPESLEEKRGYFSWPVYTRPPEVKFFNKKLKVPKVLLSGDHQKINKFRLQKGKLIFMV